MVSSVAPIKAKKLRYYADANFKRRVLPRPRWRTGCADTPPSRPDDWSGLAIPSVPPRLPRHPPMAWRTGSADDGGPRRQPELSETVAYDPELAASQPISHCSMTTTTCPSSPA